MNINSAPELQQDFIILVNIDEPSLAYLALSYLFKKGKYLPIFVFPKVDVSKSEKIDSPDVFAIQRRRAEKFAVSVNNSIVEIGKAENIIFLGLTENQKSYLYFKDLFHVLDIDDCASIEAYLGGYGAEKSGSIECSEKQLYLGLRQAIKFNTILRIGAYNYSLENESLSYDKGVIIIEETENSYAVMAINYAISIGADAILIETLQENEEDHVLNLIEEWDKGNENSLQKLKQLITCRIGRIDFAKYEFATFFTHGIPYSLNVSNIPCSMVNLSCRPDFFIFNGIYSEKSNFGGIGAVFSPKFFNDDEETVNLIRTLESKRYYLRKIIGDKAQAAALRSTILHFPFDILHVCSHGGGVNGNRCLVTFIDKDNLEHVIEFDHVLCISIYPGFERHPVESLYYFRKLDGHIWRSKELSEKNYSNEFYASLVKEITNAFDNKRVKYLNKIDIVPNTNAIFCGTGTFNYLANFDQMGGQKIHPFIFNNSCWSWLTVSTNFLYNGARGYIGTMRSVKNNEAVKFAEDFYSKVFEGNIIEAFHFATLEYLKTSTESNYVFWGLHFSKIKNNKTESQNRSEVMNQLRKSYTSWYEMYSRNEGKKQLTEANLKEVFALASEIISEK